MEDDRCATRPGLTGREPESENVRDFARSVPISTDGALDAPLLGVVLTKGTGVSDGALDGPLLEVVTKGTGVS